MKRFKDISIKTKLILITITVTLISLILGFTAILVYEYDKMKTDLENETIMSASLVGEFCVPPLSFIDVVGAEEVLQRLKNVPYIKSAIIYDEDGNLFASYNSIIYELDNFNPEKKLLITKDTTFSDEFGFNVIKPIQYKGHKYGSIHLIASKERLKSGLVRFFIITSLISLIVVVISFFPASSLQRVISKPILDLANLAKEISHKKDYSIRAEKQGNDEVGQLYDGFNSMLEQIERRDKQRDIVEIALRESEENHRVLFETMVHGVIYYDAQGRILNANKAAENLFNEKMGNLKKRNIDFSYWKVIHEDGRAFRNEEHPVWNALTNRKKIENVIMGIYNHNEEMYHWVLVSAIPIFDDDKDSIRRVYTTFNDFTERKYNEEEKEKLNKELIEKNKELEQIVYVTSHDLRSPLVNIQGFSNELDFSIQELANLSDEIEMTEAQQEKFNHIIDLDIPESLKFIDTSTRKMDSLLKGLLTLSRFGRLELNISEINMNELVSNVLNTYEFQIKENNIHVRKDNLPDCFGDTDQINQVFSNLIGNAIKFMRDEIDKEIKITFSTKGDFNVYQIVDNGMGMDKKDQDKVFELFHRLDPMKTKGEGLGLTIVKKIIERHGGKIEVDSRVNSGTVFYVYLLKEYIN